MEWIQDNIFSIISLAIIVIGFVFNYGVFYSKMGTLDTNLKDRRKAVDNEITQLETRIINLEGKSGQWERMDEKIIQITRTLDALVLKVDQLIMNKNKK